MSILLGQRGKLIPEILPLGLLAPTGRRRRGLIRSLNEASQMVRGAARANLDVLTQLRSLKARLGRKFRFGYLKQHISLLLLPPRKGARVPFSPSAGYTSH